MPIAWRVLHGVLGGDDIIIEVSGFYGVDQFEGEYLLDSKVYLTFLR